MRLKNKKYSIMVLSILVSLIFAYKFLFADSSKNIKTNLPKSKSGFFLGTHVEISLYDNSSDEIFDECFNILKDVEDKMSINIDTSEVSNINKNAGKSPVKVSSQTFSVIKRGLYYSSLSKGHFDISIGSLVKLWEIGSENAKVPSKEEIEKSKSTINYKNILLDEKAQTVKLANKDMFIDLGGIAKGYAADVLANVLKSKKIESAIINLGGNVYALGSKPNGKTWNIGIQNPFEPRGKHLGILNINNKSIVTSGVYERFLEKNGKRYHHILSPFTGYPVENSLVSITIIADNSIDADGLSTTVFSLGLDAGRELVESLDGIDAIFVTNKKEVYTTSSLKNNFSLLNNDFKIIHK
ncbi:FAD:protein FMN transferase [Clostridium ganghwense]|uniref:FAD:protein FMN transferase n=1 Tax=Clostridium ganghwense TaxID=312089 RepID=A0ABT4CXC0_9CLOT|nr:FAD:protein FMN transferase [Clostridium ganghwense]MCY6372661.1 FAD:protein FMN transferase [Clostridium ganghwense]